MHFLALYDGLLNGFGWVLSCRIELFDNFPLIHLPTEES